MRVFYCDHFVLPLPEGHRFPMEKYSRLRQRVLAEGVASPSALRVPDAATDAELLRAHTGDYVRRVSAGGLERAEVRRIGFPWSPQLVERSRRSVGGTMGACRAALEDGLAVNLAGGTHHAYADRGEGFCVFNDAAVAVLALLAASASAVRRVAILDTDVHQGNGTARIFEDDARVFTLSIHGAKNYPFQKERSDLDIGLDDGVRDDEYLAAVERGVAHALDRAAPDLAIFLSGADPFEDDRLGRLAVSKVGLAERDRLVLRQCAARGVPVAVTMGGGYARKVEDTVDVHLATVRAAARAAGGGGVAGASVRVDSGAE